MDVFDCIKKRRSIRKYSKREVSEDIILKIVDAARHAPFGGPPIIDCQLWEFIIIRDKEVKIALTHGDEERNFVGEAPVVIACCADKRKDPEYRDYDITVALAVENMLLEATECGLGACYVSCYGNHMSHQQERGLLQEILQLPDYIRLVCLITIGYPNEKPVKKELIDLKHIIHFEKWSKK